jgi:lysophospholipase L1-like esterase
MNDCNCWLTDRGLARVSLSAFRANLNEMITRSFHFGTKGVILVTKTRSLKNKIMLSGERYEEANAKYCDAIREVGAENRVVFYDIRKVFDSLTTRELEKLLRPYPDHIHLSEEGHRFYADLIWPTIDQSIKAVIEEKIKEGKRI